MPPRSAARPEFYRAATPGLWRENLSATERDALDRILGPKLSELGYGE